MRGFGSRQGALPGVVGTCAPNILQKAMRRNSHRDHPRRVPAGLSEPERPPERPTAPGEVLARSAARVTRVPTHGSGSMSSLTGLGRALRGSRATPLSGRSEAGRPFTLTSVRPFLLSPVGERPGERSSARARVICPNAYLCACSGSCRAASPQNRSANTQERTLACPTPPAAPTPRRAST